MYLEYGGLFARIRDGYFRKIARSLGVGEGTRFLDFGCGPGDMLMVVRELGGQAYGVDESPYSIERAAERGLEVVRADASDLPFDEGAFDVIFLQSVIEHMRDPVEELRQLARHLAPGGRLVVSAPTPSDAFWDDPTHVRPFTPRSYELLADLLGLRLVRLTYVFSLLLGFDLRWPIVYKILNLFPVPLGSNMTAVYEK